MSSILKLDVSYSQLTVFSSALQHPFNDWTDKHVAQGFAWRPGSVSFRTMIESGVHLVQIEVTDYLGPVGPDAVRAIDVPFEIPPDGEIEIGSISDTASLSMPSGKYLLRCEFFGSEGDTGERVSITFSRKDERRFKLVRVDENLSPEGELLLAAQAAIG